MIPGSHQVFFSALVPKPWQSFLRRGSNNLPGKMSRGTSKADFPEMTGISRDFMEEC
jgi:hypothetical protein